MQHQFKQHHGAHVTLFDWTMEN